MRILITGSSGFIGSELVRQGYDLGHTIFGFDVVEPESLDSIEVFRNGSILDRAELRSFVDETRPDAILHLAAACDISDSRTEAAGLDSYAENIEGTRNIIEIANEAEFIKSVIFTSTQLVSRVGHQPATLADCQPATFYGKSKLIGEELIHEYANGTYRWSIVRPTSVWGPGMGPYYKKFIDYIVAGKYFHISKRPLHKSYSYIQNIAYQYLRLLEAPASDVDRETFYLADYEPLSLREYADRLQCELEARPLRTFPESVCRVIARLGDVVQKSVYKKFPFTTFRVNNILTEYVYDTSKTEAVCGAVPVEFEEGVRRTAEWYLETGENHPNHRRS